MEGKLRLGRRQTTPRGSGWCDYAQRSRLRSGGIKKVSLIWICLLYSVGTHDFIINVIHRDGSEFIEVF